MSRLQSESRFNDPGLLVPSQPARGNCVSRLGVPKVLPSSPEISLTNGPVSAILERLAALGQRAARAILVRDWGLEKPPQTRAGMRARKDFY